MSVLNFRRETRFSQIVDGKNVFYPSLPLEFLTKLEQIKPNEAILISYQEETSFKNSFPLVPGGYGRTYGDSRNFLKRGPLIILSQPESMHETVEKKICLTKLRTEAFNILQQESQDGNFKAFAGYSWYGFRDRRRRIVRLHDILEGIELFRFSENSSCLEDKIVIDNIYHLDEEQVRRGGATAVLEVPRRSSRGKYKIKLVSIPLPLKRQPLLYGVEFNLSTEGHDQCGSKFYDALTFRDVQSPLVFCPHEIAAYLEVSRAISDKMQVMILQPFALATEFTYKIWNALLNHVMVEEVKKDKRGLRQFRRRVLDEAETSIALSWLVQRHGYQKTFFTRKKLKDYTLS